MKILIFIDHMESGGAARVTSILCRGLAQKGHEIVLAYDSNRPMAYACGEMTRTVNTHVDRYGKSHVAGIVRIGRKIRRYRTVIRETQPDIILGVEPEPYLQALLASIGSGIPVVAVDHTSYRRKQHWFTDWIRWHAYRWADKVSIVSHTDEKILGNRLPNKTVIYNPLSFDICRTETRREKMILCVGRKDAWNIKGFDRMMKIWDSIRSQYPEWELVFAGIEEKEPAPQVRFLGQVSDMKSLYQKTAIFVMPSRIEGFPMSLLEAASQGCACLCYALGGVTEEILTNDQSGFIVPDNDEVSFTERLSVLIENEEERKRLSLTAREQIQCISEERFIQTWEHLCHQLK